MGFDSKAIEFELDARLEALPDASDAYASRRTQWTPEMDRLLLKYWNIKTKSAVARILGISENTCRERYRLLLDSDKT